MNLLGSNKAMLRRGAPPAGVYQTTLLDLLIGIDELVSDDLDRIATARRLLGDGRIRLISRQSELSGSTLMPRRCLEVLIAEVSEAG